MSISPYFTVAGETKDFICLNVNIDAEFLGTKIRSMFIKQTMAFYQHLLDEHRLVVTDKQQGFGEVTLLCRKWNSQSDLVDKLQRQGML